MNPTLINIESKNQAEFHSSSPENLTGEGGARRKNPQRAANPKARGVSLVEEEACDAEDAYEVLQDDADADADPTWLLQVQHILQISLFCEPAEL